MFGPNTHGVVHKILGGKATDKWSKNKSDITANCPKCGGFMKFGGSHGPYTQYYCNKCGHIEEVRNKR